MQPLQHRMFQEMSSKEVFRTAQQCAFEYADQVSGRPVFPQQEALEGLGVFEEPLPEEPCDAQSLVRQLHRYGSPATVTGTGGRYFGFVTGGAIPASLAVRWLSDMWDQNAALQVMSPVVAKLEEVCQRWLRELLGLPDEVVAGFVSGTSQAIVCGLAAARYRVLERAGWEVNTRGLNGAPAVRIVTGDCAHGAVVKAVSVLGLGTGNVEWVATDSQGRIVPEALPELDDHTVLILQAGEVRTGAFDPFGELCAKARDAGAWVHIDGAFGLWAGASERFQDLTRGMEMADSWSADGHKTLNTPYDSGIVLCRDREAIAQALHASGSYLAFGDQREGMYYTPEMSRRARAVELWAVLRYLGRSGVGELVAGLHDRAVQMADALRDKGFAILNDVVFNQVLVACEEDELTTRTMEQIQASGECWVGGAEWCGRRVIRVSVCSWATTEDDVSRSVQAFAAARHKAQAEMERGRLPGDSS
ncbi:MAG: aminotransferase class V-fold PLP-dependent enzyme [Synergistales bacterium]|nr:aminotransferase class V-fold PLP-dependent enzyme [Synergistales bacterium]